MNKINEWFEHVWFNVVFWWQFSLIVVCLSGLQSYFTYTLIAVAIATAAKSAFVLFIVAPVAFGTVFYFLGINQKDL